MGAVLVASSCLAAACLFLTFRLRRALRELRTEREENRQLRRMMEFWHLQSDTQSKSLEELRRARHDLRHYLCALGGARPPDSLRDLKEVPERERAPLPGDWALSSLVSYYCSEAQRIGVQTDCRLDLRDIPGSYGADLYLIVGNLMENAVEALKREGGGWLRARSLSSPGWFSLVIGNSCSKPLHTKNGQYLSDKALGRFGIGLDTVRRVAERYGGKAKFTTDGREFRASVFLPRPASSAQEVAPRSLSH